MLSFLGIGAQKAGTTWLHAMLSKHPDIYFPEKKEQHFWNAHYDGLNAHQYFSLFDQCNLRGGDITPAYGHLPKNVIHDIFDARQDLKLVYILRNPIERAWSAAIMELSRSGLRDINADIETIKQHQKQVSIDFTSTATQSYLREQFLSCSSRQRGNYLQCFKSWLAVFPRDQLLWLRFESIAEEPACFLRHCLNHIEVRDYSDLERREMDITQKVFAGYDCQLPAEFRDELRSLYQDEIFKLSDYLKEDFTTWLR